MLPHSISINHGKRTIFKAIGRTDFGSERLSTFKKTGRRQDNYKFLTNKI